MWSKVIRSYKAYPPLWISGGLSLKSVTVTVTVAVALAPSESVATTVKAYAAMISRSKAVASRTMRVSSRLRNPKISSIGLRSVAVRFWPITRLGAPAVSVYVQAIMIK